jgi:nucleolar protein 53
MLATLDRTKALKSEIEAARNEQERKAAQRKLQKMEELRKGLAGRKLGGHTVPEGDIDVQLGEDLSESLRGLKVRAHVSYLCEGLSGLVLILHN